MYSGYLFTSNVRLDEFTKINFHYYKSLGNAVELTLASEKRDVR